jgi:hypothetical protein
MSFHILTRKVRVYPTYNLYASISSVTALVSIVMTFSRSSYENGSIHMEISSPRLDYANFRSSHLRGLNSLGYQNSGAGMGLHVDPSERRLGPFDGRSFLVFAGSNWLQRIDDVCNQSYAIVCYTATHVCCFW